MNRLEEIENISSDTLEEYAGDGSVRIPDGFGERLETALISGALHEERRARPQYKVQAGFLTGLAAAAVAVALVLTLHPEREPQDTFDNPVLAYAELERTFSYIASKLNDGMEITAEAGEAISKNLEILK